MVSPGNPSKSNLSDTVRQRILAYFQGGWAKQLDVEQMFTLINGVLPLEACLYYQVLPLFLDGNRLYLGMVTPNDTSALEYVRRIVSYLNYSLVPRAISYEALQVALTAYLNFTGTHQPVNPVKPRELFSYGHYRHSARSRTEQVDQTTRPTLILDDVSDSLQELDPAIETTLQSAAPLPPPDLPASSLPFSRTIAEEPAEPTIEQQTEQQTIGDAVSQRGSELFSLQTVSDLIHTLPILEIQASYLSSSVEVLSTLPAPMMLQELLARVLIGGIGRLYFESHLQYGRVLWSQDGVLQSVLDQLPLPIFNRLLDELKQAAEIASIPMTQPRQVEVERSYEGGRVLLRFRFMPGKHGEEATLQVLRGAALRFHQRQQLSKLKRDALGIAKQLQTKLNEIRDRAYAAPELTGTNETLPTLNQLLQSIEAQLDTLGVNEE